MRRIAVGAAAVALTLGPAGMWSMQSVSTAAPGDVFTCSASAVRVSLEGDPEPLLEPITANSDNEPCVTDRAGVLDEADLAPVGTADALFARTKDGPGSAAKAGVADITLTLGQVVPGAPTVRAEILTAEANAGACRPNDSTPPALTSTSTVARVTIGTQVIEIEDLNKPQTIDLDPIPVVVYLNQETFSDTARGGRAVTRRALFVDTPIVDVVVAEAVADYTGNPCSVVASPSVSPSVSPSTASPSPSTASPSPSQEPTFDGWMNGGGKVSDALLDPQVDPGDDATHGFVLPCRLGQTPPGGTNLEVNGDFGRFKLGTLTSTACTMDGSRGGPENPDADFNTMKGTGTGICNGEIADASWTFTDEGEPNTTDQVILRITDRTDGSNCNLTVDSGSFQGNHQAHPLPTAPSPQPSKSPQPGKSPKPPRK